MRKRKPNGLFIVIFLLGGFFLLVFLSYLFTSPLGPSLKDDLAGQRDLPTMSNDTGSGVGMLPIKSNPAIDDRPGEASLAPISGPGGTLESGVIGNSPEMAFDAPPFDLSFNPLVKQPETMTGLSAKKEILCGDTPILTILLVGIDTGADYTYGLSDVIRVVRIDFSQPTITIFALDRDIWVEIPGISDHYGITHGKLNQAYFYGVPAMGYYDGSAGGAGLLAKTLQWNFGLEVDHYVVVSMDSFVRVVDTLDGLDVYLDEPVDGGDELGAFPAGKHHLGGRQALNLARIRYGYSSLIRITNQDAIIQALVAKLSSPSVLLKAPQLLEIFKDTVLTDLSPDQINTLVCLAEKIDGDDLRFAEIPAEYYVESRIYSKEMSKELFIWDVDFDIFRYYVREFQSGRWP